MKTLLNLCCGASLAFVIALAAGRTSESIASTPAPRPPEHVRAVSRTAKTDEVSFGPHARSKVVQYFATYQAEPMGLPPACASRVAGERIPADWKVAGVTRGTLIPEADRAALVEIPAELVKVLHKDDATVRYCLAGSHLVALDAGYKVLDTLPIPTVRLAGRDATPDAGQTQLVRHIQRLGNSR